MSTGGGISSTSPYYRGTHGNSLHMSCWDEPISSRRASGDSPFRGRCPRCCYGVRGTEIPQLIGIIKPVASQPLTPCKVEEIQEPDVEFDWENKMVEQWAYARQDTMTRELFQAPRTGTPQHWDDFCYRQARCTRQWVLDL